MGIASAPSTWHTINWTNDDPDYQSTCGTIDPKVLRSLKLCNNLAGVEYAKLGNPIKGFIHEVLWHSDNSMRSQSVIWVYLPIFLIAKFMGPTWGPPGSYRPQMGPMLAPGTLVSLVVLYKQGIYGSHFWGYSPTTHSFLVTISNSSENQILVHRIYNILTITLD